MDSASAWLVAGRGAGDGADIPARAETGGMSAVDTIERALQLACDGRHRSIDDIKRTLSRENHEMVDLRLAGASIKSQIPALILKAHGEAS